MDFKNQNLINLFKPAKVNNHSLGLLISVFLPAIFVTKNIESTLIYLLLVFVFLILVSLVSKLIEIVSTKEIKWLLYILSLTGIATLLSLFQNAVFIAYSNEYNLYTYLLVASALPYMLITDNKEKNFLNSMLNTVESFLGLFLVMFLIALFREILGTGMITFGAYTNLEFSLNLFAGYQFTIFQNSLGALIILGFLLALVNKRGEDK